ncbi:MAG: efflux RND transporter periplasmic adaptor subunit [Bacteroidetes bacterium]|nr:efflux RND transporter periplasmic adaptor subunit [Bacteroidota bacterium]
MMMMNFKKAWQGHDGVVSLLHKYFVGTGLPAVGRFGPQAGVRSALAALVLAFTILACSNPEPGKSSSDTHAHQPQKAEEYYTCPMHPSVRSDRPGACPVCNMALVKKTAQQDLSADETANLQAVSLSPTQRVMANVSVVMAKRQAVSRDIQAVGIISYAEPNYKHISMRFPGRLEKLYISYTGQQVRKGDPVADVYSPEAISAQQEYLLALNSYEQASKGMQSFASSAEQLLEQAEQKLLQWGFSPRQVSRLKETRKVNHIVTVYSQVSGTVVKKSVDPQHYAATGEDMFDIADLSTVWIYLDVYERDIRFVAAGQSVQITTEAYPTEKFNGKVIFIDPVVNPETRTIRVRTEFPNPQFKLKPNMYATATINVPKAEAIVVPSTAVISTGKRNVVWVEVMENSFEPRDVVVGASRNGLTAILNGLEEGDHVVESGGYLLDSESALQQPASANPHAGHEPKPADKDHSSHPSNIQEIKIRVKDGYTPDVVKVKAGVPVKLLLQRDERSACSDEFVIETYGIHRTLRPFATTVIEFTPKEAGEIPFTCGMKMLHGKILVEAR